MAGTFAIYLNANARRVSPDVVGRIEELVHPDDIFYVNTRDEAPAHARRMLERGYATVFTGGGDGTVVALINALYAATGGHAGPGFPRIGVLSLGTGNALSRMVSSGSAIQDLKTYVSNPSSDAWPISLARCDGWLFPFGGAGIDAEILSDYEDLRQSVGQGAMKPLFRNVGGYFLAFFGATGPRRVRNTIERKFPWYRIVNRGAEAWTIGPEGEKLKPVGRDELLYAGPAAAVVAGTVPYYGYGFRLMPFADRHPDLLHLRVADIGVARALANLPAIWKGTYRGEGFHDFYVSAASIESSEPVPFQMGGDSFGRRDRIEIDLVPAAVRLLRFI
jgi:diacylglycerol kinase family enzyme